MSDYIHKDQNEVGRECREGYIKRQSCVKVCVFHGDNWRIAVAVFTLIVSEMWTKDVKQIKNFKSVFLLTLGAGQEEIETQKQQTESTKPTVKQVWRVFRLI